MTISTPSLDDLVAFEGLGSTDDLDPYSSEALDQASDLMQIALTVDFNDIDLGGDEFKLRVLKRGILAMAEAVAAGRRFRTQSVNPFYTETIGSYSYAKASKQVQAGEQTGIDWFDQAVNLLKVGDLDGVETISSISIFERDITGFGNVTGRPYVIGPADGVADDNLNEGWATVFDVAPS